MLHCESVLPLFHTNVETGQSENTHTHTQVIWTHAFTHKHTEVKEMTLQKKGFNGTFFFFLYTNTL